MSELNTVKEKKTNMLKLYVEYDKISEINQKYGI